MMTETSATDLYITECGRCCRTFRFPGLEAFCVRLALAGGSAVEGRRGFAVPRGCDTEINITCGEHHNKQACACGRLGWH